MAKDNKPGKGVRSLSLEKRVREAADELHEVCDAVVIVAVKFSGSSDNDEQIVRSIRGAQIAAFKAIDMLNEYDDSRITILADDVEDDEVQGG